VLTALDGRAGIELAARRRPDVVVLDLVMEGIDGFRVGAELQSDPATAHIPIVVFTSMELASEERRALARQMSAVLSKAPEDRRRLVGLLRELERAGAGGPVPRAGPARTTTTSSSSSSCSGGGRGPWGAPDGQFEPCSHRP
jgi:CheY-like chemotaxis protein